MSGGSLSPSVHEYIGYNSQGTFTSWRTNTVPDATLAYLYLGFNAGSSGTYTLSDTGQLSAPFELVGYCGSGTFKQYGGTNTISSPPAD